MGVTTTNTKHGPLPTNLNITDLAVSPVNIEALRGSLQDYDQEKAAFLLHGFSYGFSLHYSGPRISRESKNLKSALDNPAIVQEKINKEVLAGRVAGPFAIKPFENLIVSPIGLVPKKTPHEFRLIHHLSYPEGESINDYIDPKLASVQYTSFDAAVDMIQELGKNCKLFKMDLRNAFRLIPINPEDFELLGFRFRDLYYFDKALPFGASISCSHFEHFSTFLEFCVKNKTHSNHLLHYLDDFLGAEKNTESCRQVMDIFQSVMQEINVPLAVEKTEGPTEIIIFLGLELDSINMTVRIPKDKMDEVVGKIRIILSKKRSTLKEMQSLIGSLNFCCRAIVAGRPFCRRLINSICGLTKPFHHLRVTAAMKLDLHLWLWFFEHHNGISVFHDRFWLSNADANLFTDSAGGQDLGFGIFFQGHWCCAKWPDYWHKKGITKDITVLELFPILVALFIWGAELRNKRIRFNCDNESVVHILNSMTSKSDRVMSLVRLLMMKCLQLNVMIRATHVPGILNDKCDALSRSQVNRFRELAPEADPDPCIVPSLLWNAFSLEPAKFYNIL